jgi:hypothetical protein
VTAPKKSLRVNRPKTPELEAALSLANERPNDPKVPQPLCAGRPAEFADYDIPPSKELARSMCEACPLLDLCSTSAKHQRPEWGVQGGIAWKRGRQAHWLKEIA